MKNIGESSGQSAAAAAAAAQQAAFSMQTMQLEWLARTGMLYHRFPELAGEWRRSGRCS